MMRTAVIVLLSLGATSAVQAAELSLTESIERGWASVELLRSELEAQRTLSDVAEGDAWRRFLPNDPMLQYANQDDQSSEVLSLSESVGFPGKAFAFHRMDEARLDTQRAEFAARKYEIARTVTDAYVAASMAAELAAQQQKNVADLETLARSLHARYAAGMTTQAEIIVTDLQLRQMRADLKMADDNAALSARKFKKLLGLDPAAPVTFELPDDLDTRVLAEIGTRTADEVRTDAAETMARASHRVAWWNQLPDLVLSYSKTHYLFLPASPNGRSRTSGYGVGVSFPIFFPFTQRSAARRDTAQAVIDRSAAQQKRIENESAREEARREYDRSRERLRELREKDFPYADALMESTFSAYKSGKLGLSELVLARKTVMDLRAQDVQLRAAVIAAHLRCPGPDGARS